MYEKILIATDGSEPSKEAETHGLRLAKELGASVTALYVAEMPFSPSQIEGHPPLLQDDQIALLREAGEKIAEELMEKGRKEGVVVTPVLMTGNPAHEIIEFSKEYDLVVMGTLGRSGLSHLLLGSVAEKVVRHASVPVLVVRSRSF